MALKRNTDTPRQIFMTIFVTSLLLMGLLQTQTSWSAPGDEMVDSGAYDADDDGISSLPFKPFSGPNASKNIRAIRNRNQNQDDDRGRRGERNKYSWGKSKKSGDRDTKTNERFGKTEGKVEFRLVHDELIKEALQKKKREGKDISKAPLLPDLDTDKKLRLNQ